MLIGKHPSQEELIEAFEYVDDVIRVSNGFVMRGGLLRKSLGKIVTGSIKRKDARACIGFSGKVYYLHRLIWIHQKGEIPEGLIVDHEDTDPSHNRITNFRLLTNSLNQMNRMSSRAGSAVPYIGVSKSANQFNAFISEKGRPVFLGGYSTAEEAANIRDKAVSGKYGEVARLNRDLFKLGV